jgi:hypothetical protein
MSKILFPFLILFTVIYSANTYSQTPNWLWAKSADKCFGEGWDIATDSKGNSYITGFIEGAQAVFEHDTLFNVGGDNHSNTFLAKYDSSGRVKWVRTALFDTSGYNNVLGWSVCTDRKGSIYATGIFTSAFVTIDSFTLHEDSTNAREIFIAKYDENGNVKWMKKIIANSSFADVVDIETASDKSGNYYITGINGLAQITFDSITLNNSTGADIFLAKYDSSGNVKWAKDFNCLEFSLGLFSIVGVAADTFGNIYLTGSTDLNSHTIIFGTDTLYSSGGSFFLTKFDSVGNVLWARANDSSFASQGNSVSTDAAGNAYVAGRYDGAFVLGSYSFNDTTSGGATFIAKYSPEGNVIWVKSITNASPSALATDVVGNSFVTGPFQIDSATTFSLDFGSYQLFQPAGSWDAMFIAEYDAAGNFQCAAALQSGGDDKSSVSVDNRGNAYVTGDYVKNPMHIGSTLLSYDTAGLPWFGGEQIFIAKFNCNEEVGINSIRASGSLYVFPNPASTMLTVNTNFHSGTITMANLLGQEVFETTINSPLNNIPISTLLPGLYLLNIRSTEGSATLKVIKE